MNKCHANESVIERSIYCRVRSARFKAPVSEIATLVKTSRKLDIVKDDPPDNRILECATVTNLDFIISGDEHVLSWRTWKDGDSEGQ